MSSDLGRSRVAGRVARGFALLAAVYGSGTAFGQRAQFVDPCARLPAEQFACGVFPLSVALGDLSRSATSMETASPMWRWRISTAGACRCS